jgi:hypothetical protein
MRKLTLVLIGVGFGTLAVCLGGVLIDAIWGLFITPTLGVPPPGWRYGVGYAFFIGAGAIVVMDVEKHLPKEMEDETKAVLKPLIRAAGLLIALGVVHLWHWLLLG